MPIFIKSFIIKTQGKTFMETNSEFTKNKQYRIESLVDFHSTTHTTKAF